MIQPTSLQSDQKDAVYYIKKRIGAKAARSKFLRLSKELREGSGNEIMKQTPEIMAAQVLFMVQLIDIRRKKGITQAQLAQKIGSTQNTISRLERGETSTSLNTVFKIADALGVSVIIEQTN